MYGYLELPDKLEQDLVPLFLQSRHGPRTEEHHCVAQPVLLSVKAEHKKYSILSSWFSFQILK